MRTVADLIDRTFRTYLEPPDLQPASTRLSGALLDTDTTIALAEFDVPEDINLLRRGNVIELAQELMRMTVWDSTTRTGEMERGYLGTTAVAHADGAMVKLAPPFSRLSTFEAIRDNIVSLYPRLWTTTTESCLPASPKVYPITDDLAVEVIEINVNGYEAHDMTGHIVEKHHFTSGRAIVLNRMLNKQIWARMRRRFGVAEGETDKVVDLGMEEVWETLVMVGAAADLLAGRDLPKSHIEWVGSALETENIQVGTRSSIALGLARYRRMLMDEFSKEMSAEDYNRIVIQTTNPYMDVS